MSRRLGRLPARGRLPVRGRLPARETRRRGFALLATLWLVVGIGVVGLEWGLRARDQRRVAMNTVDAAGARAAAEAGVAHARARLDQAIRGARDLGTSLEPGARLDPWRELAAVMPDTAWSEGGTGWSVRLEDAGTRLDLNRATVDELRRLMTALRIDAGRADRVAQSIADWRDPDHEHHPRGAERDWYENAGRAVLPRNGPFQELTELRHVRGVGDELLAEVMPFLSLNGTGRVNVMAAPRPVLLALPGIGEEAARALERRRLERRPLPTLASLGEDLSPAAAAALAAELPRLMARTTLETMEVTVVSHGAVDEGPVRVRAEALVVRSRDATYLVRLEVRP